MNETEGKQEYGHAYQVLQNYEESIAREFIIAICQRVLFNELDMALTLLVRHQVKEVQYVADLLDDQG